MFQSLFGGKKAQASPIEIDTDTEIHDIDAENFKIYSETESPETLEYTIHSESSDSDSDADVNKYQFYQSEEDEDRNPANKVRGVEFKAKNVKVLGATTKRRNAIVPGSKEAAVITTLLPVFLKKIQSKKSEFFGAWKNQTAASGIFRKRSEASVVIQRAFREFSAKRHAAATEFNTKMFIQNIWVQYKAARTIQRFWRRTCAAVKIQRWWMHILVNSMETKSDRTSVFEMVDTLDEVPVFVKHLSMKKSHAFGAWKQFAQSRDVAPFFKSWKGAYVLEKVQKEEQKNALSKWQAKINQKREKMEMSNNNMEMSKKISGAKAVSFNSGVEVIRNPVVKNVSVAQMDRKPMSASVAKVWLSCEKKSAKLSKDAFDHVKSTFMKEREFNEDIFNTFVNKLFMCTDDINGFCGTFFSTMNSKRISDLKLAHAIVAFEDVFARKGIQIVLRRKAIKCTRTNMLGLSYKTVKYFYFIDFLDFTSGATKSYMNSNGNDVVVASSVHAYYKQDQIPSALRTPFGIKTQASAHALLHRLRMMQKKRPVAPFRKY